MRDFSEATSPVWWYFQMLIFDRVGFFSRISNYEATLNHDSMAPGIEF
jgi:hypothetical protein